MAKLNSVFQQVNEVNGIDLDIAGSQLPGYKGTLKEMLDLVADGTIVPIVQDGQIIGGNCNSGCGDLVQDNLMQKKFIDAYRHKPIIEWMLFAVELKKYGLKADEVVRVGGNDYVINYANKVAVDTNCNIVAQLETNEMLFGSSITERLVEMINTSTSANSTTSNASVELPNEVEVSVTDLPTASSLERSVKKYLRNTYKCCLSADNDMTVMDLGDTVKAVNITWGRKLSRSEIAALGE